MVAVSVPAREHVEMERGMSKIPTSSQNKRISKGRELSLNVSLLLILKKKN